MSQISQVEVRDMHTEDEYFVATCSHRHESGEIDACAERRLTWFRHTYEKGVRIKVALIDGEPVGFLYVMPIEVSPWGPLGEQLMVMPCMYVIPEGQHKGAGRGMIGAAVEETRAQGRKGLVTNAYDNQSWFMPAAYFRSQGFEIARQRRGQLLMWRVLDPTAEKPDFLQPVYQYHPVPGKVIVDLFTHSFCLTVTVEAERVRQVAQEFGERVIVNEHDSDDMEQLWCHQLPRGIFVNGKEVGWGFEAPKEGIRDAIEQALARR